MLALIARELGYEVSGMNYGSPAKFLGRRRHQDSAPGEYQNLGDHRDRAESAALCGGMRTTIALLKRNDLNAERFRT